MTSKRSAWILYLGDAVCLALFVLLGLRQHEAFERGGALARFGLNAGPLLLTWTLAGLALGAFRFPLPLRLRAVWARTLMAWLVAAPVGLLLRAWLLQSATVVVIFVLVTLLAGGLLLLAWRSLYLWLAYGRRPAAPPAASRR